MPQLWQQTADETITAFASVRNNMESSSPSFGDYLRRKEQESQRSGFPADVVPAIIEVSRGSPNKYEVEKETGQLMLDRVLHSSVYYPGDYGYVPHTLCGDGDPLDIIIVAPIESLNVQALDTGIVANCRVVGVMDMEDESGHDEKLIAVLANQRSTAHVTELEHVPQHLRREIQHFFENYKALEVKKGKAKWARVLGWGGKEEAMKVVEQSRRTHQEKYPRSSHQAGDYHSFVSVKKGPSMLHVEQGFGKCKGPGEVTCFVNVSKGSLNSYVYRPDTTYRHFKYSLSMPYPGNYGLICQTWQSEVEKPLEVLIMTSFPVCPECLIDARIIGAFERTFRLPTKDGGFAEPTKDVKMVAVMENDPRMTHVMSLSDMNPQSVGHFGRFFLHTAEAAGCSESKILQTMQASEAVAIIRAAHKSYLDNFSDREVHNAPNLWCLPWGREATAGEMAERVYPAIVEASKYSSVRYSLDASLGVLRCIAPMSTSAFWPGNIGLIPQTVAEDGRPVDVMILSTVPLQNKSVVEVRIVGAAECMDEMGPDIKVIGVPKSEPRMKEWVSINDVPAHMRDEMVHFLNCHKDLEADWRFCRFERFVDTDAANHYISNAHSRFFLFVLPMQRLEQRVRLLEEENARLRGGDDANCLSPATPAGGRRSSPWDRQTSGDRNTVRGLFGR